MQGINVIHTNVPNLDEVLGGGVPVYSLNIIAGQPGTGKTILTQQMLFGYIRDNDEARVLYLNTLSEPAVKVVRYVQFFDFFDVEAFGERVIYQDIGRVVREQALDEVADHIMRLVEEHRPEVLVIDSFKAIRDLCERTDEFRRFCYDLSVRLAGARSTTFLVGEYDHSEIAAGAEFAVADGIIGLHIAEQEGEKCRFVQVHKLRGGAPEMAPFPFVINESGVRVLSSTLTLRGQTAPPEEEGGMLSMGVVGLDRLLRGGIPRGRAVLLSGVSGTGKTSFGLQFLMSGTEQGQRGVLFSFEETSNRLRHLAKGFGWNLGDLEEEGLLRIVAIPQTTIRVEEHLEQMVQVVAEFQPDRVVVDSFSVFLHKVTNPAIHREKAYQLAALMGRTGAVGLLISDIPSEGPDRLSRFGVEETLTDGTIVFSTLMKGLDRKRYIEVYKMRSVDHVPGRHRMEITRQGIEVFYTEPSEREPVKALPLSFQPVREVLRGDVSHGSSWLVRGDPGVGKSTLAYQFVMEGLRRREGVLYIAADAPAYQVRKAMENFGFLVDPYLESEQLVILDTFGGEEIHLDMRDPEAFLFLLGRRMEEMPRPLRLVVDSLTPLALGYEPGEFVALVHRMNRLLGRADVAIFDIMLRRMLEESDLYSLLNAFDVVLDLYTPDWGDMSLAGNVGYRALQVRKARGVNADTRPFPYTISPTEGVVVEKDFYRRQMGE